MNSSVSSLCLIRFVNKDFKKVVMASMSCGYCFMCNGMKKGSSLGRVNEILRAVRQNSTGG